MNATPKRHSVYDEYFDAQRDDEFSVIDLGPGALTYAHLVEQVFLVPTDYIRRLGTDSTITWEMMMAAAWEALTPMARHGVGPALGAQTLAALGGNPQRAAASPRRHVRLILTALDGFRGRNLPRHEGRAYVELGRALVGFRRIPDAMTAYQRGRALLESVGDDHGLRAAHARLAALMSRLGLYEQALLHAEAGQRVGERLTGEPGGQLPVGHVHFTEFLHDQRVRALTRIGFVDEAEAALGAWRREGGHLGNSFDLLAATAELRVRQERITEGLDAYMRAIDARFAHLDTVTLPGRTHYLENSVTLFGRAVGSALHIGRPDLAVGVLAAMATRRPVRPDDAPPPVAADALRNIDAQVSELARRATGAAVARDHATLFDHNDRARALLETRDTLLHETGRNESPGRTTVEELAFTIPRAVGPGELALAYGRDDLGRVIVFAVHDGTVRHLPLDLSADEVAELTALAHDECVRRTGTDSVHRLGEAVLEPVADLLETASRVYVTAHGVLEDFPFHAAPFRGRPLVVSAEVRALPSLAPLGSNGGRRGPLAGGSPKAVVAAVRQPRYELLPELPALRAEAAAVRAAFPHTTGLYDDQATAGATLDALGTADVLHIAGHASFEPAQPNMARILLADRPLFAFEIACAPRAPRLVNLSGCRTGAERRTLGGEGEGLAAAFLAAGTETVVAPLWPVRDDAALAFNEALYGQLAAPGVGLAQATRRAQLAVMADPRFAHPGLWGAFTVLGSL
ncbi:CHAT domain-containing protein [Streptomyces sporangiiformans]|uniref:CHAT domain-containing protein n=1 Tax=Streptomyces sporangiiformans TaxID=2315329 RepID=A0A505D847_9ACTN|nr:CHAT domain-containing protein [Streptomyces sporangiiformans]TPQ17955.1 CHAT domain-containing protein [Streptomyces sporangiiformans]